MKRKVLFGLVGLAFVAAAAITTVSTINANSTYESDLLTKNLVALTQDESVSQTTCETKGVFEAGVRTFMCDICDFNPNTAAKWNSNTSLCP
jgi:hypothetical protein